MCIDREPLLRAFSHRSLLSFHLPVDLCTGTVLHSPRSDSYDPFLVNCDVFESYDVQFICASHLIVLSLTNLKSR